MADPTWPDLAGRLTGGGHVLPVRVYYEDTDFSGFVYHASHLRFMERGRSDFLRLLGIGHHALARGNGLAFAVRRMAVDFLRTARIDEVLTVETAPEAVGGARIELRQRIRRSDEVVVEATVTVAMVDGEGRARRIPATVRERLAGFGSGRD